MATINLGAIKFNWKGAYNSGTAYAVDDVVSSGGSSYVCILASTGNATSNGTYWEQMSSAGTNGTDGATGAEGGSTTLTTQGDILYRDGSGLQRLPKGTAGQVLQMNSGATAPEYATASSGGILQVKNTQLLTSADYSGSSFGSITGLSVAITPSATTNRLWIMVTVNGQHSTGGMNSLFRVRDVTNSQIAVGGGYDWYHSAGGGVSGHANMQGFYTPPNTNAMTFEVQVAQMANGTYKLNKAYNSDVNGQSTITVFEIASAIL